MGLLKKKFRNIKKFPNWIFWILARFMQIYLRLCFRIKVVDPNGYIDGKTQVIGITWHNRLMFFAAIFPKATRKVTVAVVSASRDGQYIADFIHQLGLKSLRGSSSKGGAKAQLGAIRAINDKYNVVFTPDGPRGPKYRMKKGPIVLSSKMQVPIVPLSINASKYWSAKSWDNFQIPKPFSTLTLVIGDAINIPPDLDDAGVENYLELVNSSLMDISKD